MRLCATTMVLPIQMAGPSVIADRLGHLTPEFIGLLTRLTRLARELHRIGADEELERRSG
jgi:hypothetical protein